MLGSIHHLIVGIGKLFAMLMCGASGIWFLLTLAETRDVMREEEYGDWPRLHPDQLAKKSLRTETFRRRGSGAAGGTEANANNQGAPHQRSLGKSL